MPLNYTGCFTFNPFLTLAVTNASRSGGVYYADYNPAAGNYVEITATTTAGAVVWNVLDPAGVVLTGGGAVGGDKYRINLDDATNVFNHGQVITVNCAAGGINAAVQVVVRPIVASINFVADHLAFQQGANWRATNLSTLVPDARAYTANMQAVLAPATPAAATYNNRVEWSAKYGSLNWGYNLQDLGNPIRKGIRLNHTRTVTSKARVSGNANWCADLDLEIQDPATSVTVANNLTFELYKFTYGGGGRFPVAREEPAHFNANYSADWESNVALKAPQGYVADENCTLSGARIRVTTEPNADTRIDVRATAYLKHANGNYTVVPVEQTITVDDEAVGVQVVGDFDLGDLPDEVMCLDPMLVFWEVRNNPLVGAVGDWLPLAVTANSVYVTADTPDNVANALNFMNSAALNHVYPYLSLLDMSCRAANGQNGANNVRDAIYAMFTPANPNARVRRITPGNTQTLRYWSTWSLFGGWHIGRNPAQRLNISATNMFNSQYGNISCCVWAQLLIAMWALHGKTDANYVKVDTGAAGQGFLVRDWDYNNHGAMNAGAYTHNIYGPINQPPVAGNGNRAAPVNTGAAGQNNPNPPPSFGSHFIVLETTSGNLYDPSYGSLPVARNAWVQASLAGRRRYRQNQRDQAGYATYPGGNLTVPNNVVRLRNLQNGAVL